MDRNSLEFLTLKSTVIAVLFFISLSVAYSQYSNKVNFYTTGGLMLRTGIMNFFNFKYKWPSNVSRPYNSERNINGFSLSPGILFKINHLQIEYFAGLRYDVLYIVSGKENTYQREFILDHHFNFSLKVRKLSYGVGSSIVNAGKSFTYNTNIFTPNYIHESLEFRTINGFVTFPVWKTLNLEIKAIYMPNGYPYNRQQDFIMYSTRLFYKFKFLNKNKEI